MNQDEEVIVDDNGDDLEIEVVDDDQPVNTSSKSQESNTAVDEDGEATDEEIAAYGKRAQKRIAKLVWERSEERRKRESQERMTKEAIAHAERLLRDNQRLTQTLESGKTAYVDQVEQRAKLAVQNAQVALRQAYEAGDTDKMAEAQQALTDAQLVLRTAAGSAHVAFRPKEQERQVEQESKQRQEPVREEPEVDEKARKWFSNNAWFGKDPEMTSFAYGVHEKLIMEGIDPNSDEYYKRIDKRMRTVFPGQFADQSGANGEEVDVSAQRSKPNTIVAKATRTNGAKPQKIVLTQTQVRTAKRLGVSLQDYARQLIKDGLV